MVEFYDGWETAQTWTVLWSAVVNRVTTDPFQGSYCVQMDDPTSGGPAGLSKDNIFDPSEDEYLRIAIKNISPTEIADVYIYKPDHSRVAFIFGVEEGGECFYQDNMGYTFFYYGDLNKWYEFRVVIKWAEEKFDIAVYDRNGNKLAEVKDRTFLNATYIATIAHILLYSPISSTGTAYFDGCSVATYYPPSATRLDIKEAGIMLGETLIDPPPQQGYWIVGYWMRRVRARYDKTLADDHNIAKAILSKIRDVESQKT